jgi:hypothetical protein
VTVVTAKIRSVIDFYERHPISSQIILAKLKASRGHLNDVAPEESFPHDQDHYGGLDANGALAQRAVTGSLHRPLSDADRKLMWQGTAVTDLYSLQAYGELIRAAGFTVCSIEDLTVDWGVILKQRLAMYMKLREEAREANTPAGHDTFYESYVRFVDLVNNAVLGGGRFVGEKPR